MKQKPNALTFTIFDEFLPMRLSKSQRRRIEIIEATIKMCASDGVDNLSYDILADKVGVSRRLVQHYFPDRAELVLTAIKYVRGRLQAGAVKAIESECKPSKQLSAYVDSVFEWAKTYPADARIWLLFFYLCSVKSTHHRLNTELVILGHQRICTLLKSGVVAGDFAVKDIPNAAKLIQTIISGAFVETFTEKKIASLASYAETAKTLCLAIARGAATF
jgi:AcrR family transcriptional regulator